MAPRKKRTPVVLDTNVFVRAFKARLPANDNRRIVRLWLLERKLQLIVSEDLVEEYLGVFHEVLGFDDDTIAEWQGRFLYDARSTAVGLGRRFTLSRDPDDDLLLAVASSGQAQFLITNDRDLLEIPRSARRPFRFEIVPPREFLTAMEAAAS